MPLHNHLMRNFSTLLCMLLPVTLLDVGLVPPMMAAEKSAVFRTSNTETYSTQLGVNSVPAYVMLNKVPRYGLYITNQPTNELGRDMGLVPGAVLLTIDGYSMTSGSIADSWIAHRPTKPMIYTYAVVLSDGNVRIRAGQVQATTTTRTTGTGPGTATTTMRTTVATSSAPGGAWVVSGTAKGGGNSRIAQTSDDELAKRCLSLVNESRTKQGLGALQLDPTLTRFAALYADYMAQNPSQFELSSSRNPHEDLQGRFAEERARMAGLKNFLYENIGRSTRGSGELAAATHLHGQMMESEGHRVAILSPKANLVGFGFGRSRNNFFMTEVFGE